MKRIGIGLLFIWIVGLVGAAQAAPGIQVCRDTSVAWVRFRFSGAPASLGYLAAGASLVNGVWIMDALPDGTASLEVGGIHLTASLSTPVCGGGYGDAPSIYVVADSDCFYVDTHNADDGWSRVADSAHPDGILLHYGEALIGSPNQSTNADDYRAVETACY